MFRAFSRLPARRCLHSGAQNATRTARPSRLVAALGASAIATSYFAWRALQGDTIALDSVTPGPSKKQVPLDAKASVSPDAIAHSPSTATSHEPSINTQAESQDAAGNVNTSPDPVDATEEGSSGAFNPATGEINWDCPCLGGMAHGPCGPQFREAFSCFVFSEAEPKGIECVEKFKAMQDCFRLHPDVYGEDIMADDDDDEQPAPGTVVEETTVVVVESPESAPTHATIDSPKPQEFANPDDHTNSTTAS
ncbi:hypothetical protein CERSUDRAFT_83295 [Gelatoporia subvermispora B]|uniref:Mitochondrial intermembrane space import and assembly protein 40 n=1 Tax=Ceriporiopsis subvermispora (strain B) TaxID=914234 RepID=M2QZE0_CERS8|nr:hypothetical protein CERSUDRAFT_83295 [Gelatoporia subvermispora B]